MNKEAVQMFATPTEGILKDFMEFGDTGCADHEQSPPHSADSRRGALREVDRSQWTIPKVQACEQFIQATDDPPESPALLSQLNRTQSVLAARGFPSTLSGSPG